MHQDSCVCVVCGNVLLTHAKFCSSCGTRQPVGTSPGESTPAGTMPDQVARAEQIDSEMGLTDLSYGEYRQLLFRIAHTVRRLHDIAHRGGSAEERPLAELLRLIEASHFSIAVVGEFKRGKSTFINALLGDEVLPADIEPCSATVNRVTYGLTPSARIVFRAQSSGQDERTEMVPIERLSAYVTKLTPESATMSSTVKEAVIAYPVSFCKNNVDIIDTPGLNDDPVMTGVTLEVLSQVHAAIMVVMANAPFGESESTFLREVLLKEHASVMFVVTAIDRIRRAPDRARVLNAIKSRIVQTIEQYAVERYGQDSREYTAYLQRMQDPKIFGLSGYQALQARRERNGEQLASSGFPAFEVALEQFLTRERGAHSLIDLIERVVISGNKLTMQLEEGQATLVRTIKHNLQTVQTAAARHAEVRGQYRSALNQMVAQTTIESLTMHTGARLDAIEMELKIAAGRVVEMTEISALEITTALKETIGDAVGNTGQKLLGRLPSGQAQQTGKRYVGKVSGWISGRTDTPPESSFSAPEEMAPRTYPGTASYRLCEELPAEMARALTKVWKSFMGSCHAELQRMLQAIYEQLRHLARTIDQAMLQTAEAFQVSSQAGSLAAQLDHSLLQLTSQSGIWAAEDGAKVRLGPTLPILKENLDVMAGLVQPKVTAWMLRSQDVDQLKGQLIRTTSEHITRQVAPRIADIRQILGQEAQTCTRALTDTAYHLFESVLQTYAGMIQDIIRTHERTEMMHELATQQGAQQISDVATMCGECQKLSRSLRRLIEATSYDCEQ